MKPLKKLLLLITLMSLIQSEELGYCQTPKEDNKVSTVEIVLEMKPIESVQFINITIKTRQSKNQLSHASSRYEIATLPLTDFESLIDCQNIRIGQMNEILTVGKKAIAEKRTFEILKKVNNLAINSVTISHYAESVRQSFEKFQKDCLNQAHQSESTQKRSQSTPTALPTPPAQDEVNSGR